MLAQPLGYCGLYLRLQNLDNIFEAEVLVIKKAV